MYFKNRKTEEIYEIIWVTNIQLTIFFCFIKKWKLCITYCWLVNNCYSVLHSVLSESEGYSVLIRACVVDNGGINSETEIGRISHCWFVRKIKYMERYMYGCSVACDTDGCNNAIGHRPSIWMVTWATIMALCCVAKQWIILWFQQWSVHQKCAE